MAQSMEDYLKSYGVSTSTSSSKKNTSSSSSSSKKSSSSSSSSTPKVYETWESNGRTYVDGIDVGPSGTSVQPNDGVVSNSMSAYLSQNGVSPNMGEISTEKIEYNPYEDYYKEAQKRYEELEAQIREQNRLAVEQGTNRLNAQKDNINQAADENARQAYVQYMQSQKALPQQLASQGVTGGATETANLGVQTAYQNNVNSINQNKANRLQEIDNAIVDLQNTGDLTTVEQVLANNQAALDAYTANFDKGVSYNQWANQYNANRLDTIADQAYRDQAYRDQMTQQQLENEWYERNYSDSKKQNETNTVISLLENGLVDVNYASALLNVPVDQLNSFVNYINKARNLELSNTQSLINNRNNSGSGGGSGAGNTADTVSQNIKNYLGSNQTTANIDNDNLTAAKYLVDQDLDVADVLNIAEQNKIPIEIVARAMKQAGYDNTDIELTIKEYYGGNVTDNYIAAVLRSL